MRDKMERTEMRMTRWICGVSLRERSTSTELQRSVETIGEVMRMCRLRWNGHVERKGDAKYVADVMAPVGKQDLAKHGICLQADRLEVQK